MVTRPLNVVLLAFTLLITHTNSLLFTGMFRTKVHSTLQSTNHDSEWIAPDLNKMKVSESSSSSSSDSGSGSINNGSSSRKSRKSEKSNDGVIQKSKRRAPRTMAPVLKKDMDKDANDLGLGSESDANEEVSHWVKYNLPVGSDRAERLDSAGGSDMDVTFLGTASCIPTLTRGVSSTAFRFNGDMWLFDCGEASQIQIQRSSVVASKIKKIFITHAHGDHSFGLPGVLCMLGQSTQTERENVPEGETIEPIDIYGPEGTRDLIRSMIQLTYSRIVAPHRIHELKQVPYLHFRSSQPPPPMVRTRFDPRFGEVEGSQDIFPNKKGHYHLLDNNDLVVMAAPMQHTIPCVGYVISEKQKPGRLRFEKCEEVVENNREALKKQFQDPNKMYAKLKALNSNESITFPDGTILCAKDIVEPPREGRKVVIMGDTCSGDFIAPLAMGADVLIHEATNAWLPNFDGLKFSNYELLEEKTKLHGHSTPEMAGAFAKRIGARQLVLTHFSPRYRGDSAEGHMKVMWKIEGMARKTFGAHGKNDVIAAWDHMELNIPS